jgi:hypothetical protein
MFNDEKNLSYGYITILIKKLKKNFNVKFSMGFKKFTHTYNMHISKFIMLHQYTFY